MGVYCSGIRDLRAPPCRRSAGGAGLAGAPGAAAPARGFCFGFGTLPKGPFKNQIPSTDYDAGPVPIIFNVKNNKHN